MKKHVKVIFDRRGLAEKKGTGVIDICIYLNRGERKYESVGSATPDRWEVVAQDINIQAKVKHYEEVIKAMQVIGEEMTIANFNSHIIQAMDTRKDNADNVHMFKGHDQRQSFTEFIEYYLDKEGLRDGSRRNIQVVIDSLIKFNGIKCLKDLTPANLRKYDEWLHSQGDKSVATIYNYHKKVHKYTHILWRNEMIPSDPYNHVSFKRGSYKERKPLTEEELLRIRQADYAGKLGRVRDLFIFMAYTGLSYVDMCNFNFLRMAEKQGDTYYIEGERVKTGSSFYTPILPPALAVLEKYNYKLPTITNQKLNDYLHVIEADLKINKKITCHVARHSFATLLLTYDFPMDKTARALGHKDIKTTQIYAKVLKKTIVQHTEHLVAAIQ
jgi:site-specific recombinase XerD